MSTPDYISLRHRFEEVKSARLRLFQACFKHVSESLAVIYKDLTRSSKHPLGGNAYLSLDSTEEPYAGGVRYTAMPPSKRFRLDGVGICGVVWCTYDLIL